MATHHTADLLSGLPSPDETLALGPSLLAISSPGDLSLNFTLAPGADVAIANATGSAWVLDARAAGKLTVVSLEARDGRVSGGGLLRGVGAAVELQHVLLDGMHITAAAPFQEILATDAVI